jgi:hypothetical protein
MDVRRKANRESQEITLQYQTRREAMLVDELNEDRLNQLLAFIDRLQQTPPGSAELRHRTKLFGECKRIAGETTIGYYGKLRQWLDRDLPQPKSRRRRSRQADES